MIVRNENAVRGDVPKSRGLIGEIRACIRCGETFAVPRTNRTKAYCSRQCARQVNNDRRAVPKQQCRCGRMFSPVIGGYSRKRWCSQQCARDAKAALKPVVVSVRFHHCGCGKLFKPLNGERSCSAECRDAAAKRTYLASLQADLVERPCAECGREFTPAAVSGLYGYCTPLCRTTRQRRMAQAASKADKAKRRGVRVEKFDPAEVLSRDDWTCQLCGIATPPELRGSYAEDAPELDHIVPISRGGMHCKSNTRCLCRSCNGRKGNMLDSEMLACA